MYLVLKIMHMLNFLDIFSVGVTSLVCLSDTLRMTSRGLFIAFIGLVFP